MFSIAIPIVAAAAVAIGAAAAPLAPASNEPSSITGRSPRNPDAAAPGYRLVLTQIDETGEESSTNEMFISFPETASDPQSELYPRLNPTNQCTIM